MTLKYTKIIASTLISIIASSAASDQVKLYKDISLGDGWDKILGSAGYYDCSESGLKIACLDNQKFLGATGDLGVIFESEVAQKVMFISQELSLYQQSMNFFPSKGFTLAMIETDGGANDFIAMINKLGAQQALARISEAEQYGMSTGFVKYTFLEFDQSKIKNFGNTAQAYTSLNSGDRALTLSVSEDLQGLNVSITFEPSFVDAQKLRENNTINEDF